MSKHTIVSIIKDIQESVTADEVSDIIIAAVGVAQIYTSDTRWDDTPITDAFTVRDLRNIGAFWTVPSVMWYLSATVLASTVSPMINSAFAFAEDTDDILQVVTSTNDLEREVAQTIVQKCISVYGNGIVDDAAVSEMDARLQFHAHRLVQELQDKLEGSDDIPSTVFTHSPSSTMH